MKAKMVLYAILFIIITYISAILHEFGHYLSLMYFGMRNVRVEIVMTYFDGNLRGVGKVVSLLMGLFVNIILFGISYYIYRKVRKNIYKNIFGYFSSVNIIIAFACFISAIVPGTDLNQIFSKNIIVQLLLFIIGVVMYFRLIYKIFPNSGSDGKIEKIMFLSYFISIVFAAIATKAYIVIGLGFGGVPYLSLRIGSDSFA